MTKKSEHVLASTLASATFRIILAYKNGVDENGSPLSVYGLAKKIYGVENFNSPVRIYGVLKQFKKENLIQVEKTVIKGRNAEIVKPNFKRFAELLNEFKIPSEHKLTEEEIEKLAGVLEKIDYSKLGFGVSGVRRTEINVLDTVAIFLKFACAYVKIARERKIDPQKLSKFLETALLDIFDKQMAQQYNELFSLDDATIEKLDHTEVPEWVEILLLLSTSIGEIAENVLKGALEKKQRKTKSKI